MTLTLLAGLLQLVVPSYAFRLVRRFGAQRVGWFVVTAFVCMATLHLLAPLQTFRINGIPDLSTNLLVAIGSVMLLIGMGHLETVCSEREQALRAEAKLRQEAETQWQHETRELTQTNHRLLEEVSRLELRAEALGQSATQYGFLFEENPQPMWIIDLANTRLLATNKAALRQLGFTAEEMAGLNALEILAPEMAGQFQTDLARPCATAQARGVWPHLRKDGSTFDLELSAVDLNCTETPARLIVAQDVTERERRQAEFLQTQKMNAIGKVSGGVGQQFSGILTGIESHAASLLPKMTDARCIEQVKNISAAATRGAGLTRQLLATGSRHQLQTEVLDVNTLVRNLNHMLIRLVGERIIVQYTYGSFVAPILGDARLIENALVNLILNARDAIPKAGTITISTTTLRFERKAKEDGAPVGEFVRLMVRDSGCGMTPEVQAHLFEPFFTTRDSSRAMGLGLASVYGIVRQHSGWIEVSSEPGWGSEFRIFLPCAPAYEMVGKETRAAAPVAKGTVLLVEPDDRTRSMARCALNWQGYRVIEADSSALALQFWESQSAKIDLLLTDANLDESLSGFDLANQLCQSKPGLKVICTSEMGDEGEAPLPARGGLKLMAKPFTREKLLAEVQSSLAAEG
ncbi:MAG: PAS domain S-box protein [Akkermansiaceae bacterium]|nr:PAS domain S-box protein [Verrucomicrobiales bacterium]